jgi:hypothetical protein
MVLLKSLELSSELVFFSNCEKFKLVNYNNVFKPRAKVSF